VQVGPDEGAEETDGMAVGPDEGAEETDGASVSSLQENGALAEPLPMLGDLEPPLPSMLGDLEPPLPSMLGDLEPDFPD
jgi:hypothetical protein